MIFSKKLFVLFLHIASNNNTNYSVYGYFTTSRKNVFVPSRLCPLGNGLSTKTAAIKTTTDFYVQKSKILCHTGIFPKRFEHSLSATNIDEVKIIGKNISTEDGIEGTITIDQNIIQDLSEHNHVGNNEHRHHWTDSLTHIRNKVNSDLEIVGNHILGKRKLVSNTDEWRRLNLHHSKTMKDSHLRDLLQDQTRCDNMYATYDGIYLDYSRQKANLKTMELLYDLAKKQDLESRIQGMFRGEKINFTENRAVLHTALRSRKSEAGSIIVDGEDVVEEVHQVLESIKNFSENVRNGSIRGHTGKRIRNFVSVGIGGSYLGPEFLHEVLKTEDEGISASSDYTLRFLANIDPVDVERTCADLDPEETMVIIISKTFTTAETMLNARTVRQWLWDSMGREKEIVQKHMIACSCTEAKDKVEAFGIDTDNHFFKFWEWVGGRYSVCSAVGAVPISLQYGYELFEKFLQGAKSVDDHFLSAPMEKNIPIIMGLLGVWNMSFLGYRARATLPYAEALIKLPAHIQQLDMESNGKHVNKYGIEVDYEVGELDFGEPGTNGQHSFFQLLHMGQVVPCEFIGFIQSQYDISLDGEDLSNHDELMSNFFAQPDALANGKTEQEVRDDGMKEDLIKHRVFRGDRPSFVLLMPKLTAYATGQILALYEHRTAVQGFIWDINSFDQWGVELGKKLATNVKEHLMEARSNPEHAIDAGSPATTRLLNYYIDQSSSFAIKDEDDSVDVSQSVTRRSKILRTGPRRL